MRPSDPRHARLAGRAMARREFGHDPEQPAPMAFLDSPDESMDALADYRRRMDAAREDRAATERMGRTLLMAFLGLLAGATLTLAFCHQDATPEGASFDGSTPSMASQGVSDYVR